MRNLVPFRWLRLGAVAAVLLACTACLEHLEAVRTRVTYDPFHQTFDVERRLVGVEARFLGCHDTEDCVASLERVLTGAPSDTFAMALSDRLLQRLRESGGTDIEVELERHGERLDAVVRYRAPVGTAAADDTLVKAEWSSTGWPLAMLSRRGYYYLVIDAQPSMAPPKRHHTRRIPRAGTDGVDWVEAWVMPRRRRTVETTMVVGGEQGAEPLFAELPDLVSALSARGWLDESVAVAADVPAADGPTALASAPPEADPESPAKTWVYDARVNGGGLTPAAAGAAIEPLIPSLSGCYQRRQGEVPELGGSVFLSALVKGDGSVVATSVSGDLTDPPLVACLDGVLARWTFPAWGAEDAVSDVAIPVVFRVEGGGARTRRQ